MVEPLRGTLVGVFPDREHATLAVEGLKRAGFRDDQIGLAGRAGEPSTRTGSQAEEGTVLGMMAGAGLGSLVGLGIVAGVIPAIGPVVAGGTLAGLLANAAGGAAVVGAAGTLIGAGVSESSARYYEGELHAGRVIVTVRVDGREVEAASALRQAGAFDMHAEGVPAAEGARRAGSAVAGAEDTLESPAQSHNPHRE